MMGYRYIRFIVLFDLPVEIAEDKTEYGKFYRGIIKAGFLIMQESIYCKLEYISSSKYELITSPFIISLNSKKLLGSALKDIETSICENYYDKFQEINTDIVNLLDQSIMDLSYEVSFDCIKDMKDIIKVCDISFEEKQLSLLEKITDYI